MNDNIKNKVDSIDKSKLNARTKEVFERLVKGLRSKDPKVSDKSEEMIDKIIANAKAKNSDIFVAEKTSKANKEDNNAKVKSRRQDLFDAIQNDPKLSGFNKFQSVIEIDAERVALPKGKRVSKKGWKNQYGKSTGGHTYYETRENRMDRIAPITRSSTPKPWLKYGGEIEEGKYAIVVEDKNGNEKLANTKNSMDEAMAYATLKKNVIGRNGIVKVYNDEKECVYKSFYEDGGELSKKVVFSFSFNTDNISLKEVINLVKPYSKDWRTSGDISEVNFFITLKQADALNLRKELKSYGYFYDFEMENSRYEDGGYMAKGGELTKGDKINILGEEYEFVRYETDKSQGYDEERVILKSVDKSGLREYEILSYPRDMVESYSNYKMAKGGGVLSLYKIIFKNSKGEYEYMRTEAYNKADAMKVGKYFETYPSQFMRGGFKVVEVKEVEPKDKYEDGGYMAKGGEIFGDRLNNVRSDAKSLSRNYKQDMFIIEQKEDNFSPKRVVTQFTIGTKEDVDYIREKTIKNENIISIKILGKYSNGELKSSEEEILYMKSKYAKGGEMDDEEGVDLFEDFEDQPEEVSDILSRYEQEDNNYDTLNDLLAELKPIGYTFEFGLDAEPYDLRKIGQKGKSEFYAKGGVVVTKISNIPNFKQRLSEGKITYRGLGMGKISDDFYNLAGEHGTRIKVDGKEYYITDTEFNSFSRGADGKLIIRFDAPYRKSYAEGGQLGEINTELINVKNNIMGTTTLEMKIKGMRKPQNFIVYPISAEQANKPIMIQSDTRFGFLDLSTGEGLMSQSHANGAYSYHFQTDKKVHFKLSETDVQRIKSDLSKKAGSKVGNSVIFSDNSGANMMAKGGAIENQYEGRTPKDIWDNLSKPQRSHFILDHAEQIEGLMEREFESGQIRKAMYSDYKNLDPWIKNRFDNHTRVGQYAEGGKVDESTKMVLSQNKAIAHHTQELKNALKKNPNVEPWVIGKVGRAETDISDVTHYLDGRSEYAEGGVINSMDLSNLKKGDKISITYASSINRSNEKDLMVQSKTTVNKGKQNEKDKTTFINLENPNGVKYYAYLRKDDGYIGFAIGDMAISNVKLVDKFRNGGNIREGRYIIYYEDPTRFSRKRKVASFDSYEKAKEELKKLKYQNEDIDYSIGNKSMFEEKMLSTTFAKGGEIKVNIGDKVKSKSGVDGIVYESTGTMFKLQDKYGNKSPKWHSSRDFKASEIKQMKLKEGGRLGFEGLSEKVAKKYEGMKVPSKYQKEYGKTYSKEEAKEVGNKVAYKVYKKQGIKMAEGGETEWFDYSKAKLQKLPYKLDDYFTKSATTKRISLSRITPIRAREEGVMNANKYMKMSAEGKMAKRKPITVRNSKGMYEVVDGNSTFANAKFSGWKTIYVDVVKNSSKTPKTLVKGQSIFEKAKAIRKEGENWQDALQRAKKM